MKKLVLVGMVVGMVFGAKADAQIYEMTLNVKTTVSRNGKVGMVSCDCRTDTNTLYRANGIMKIKGVIWGCDCGTLTKEVPYTTSTNPYGYFFWNVTTKKPLNLKLTWPIANRIGNKATNVETTWCLSSEDGSFYLLGSGFGKLTDQISKDPCQLVTSQITSLAGNCAGWMTPGAIVTTKATKEVCTWCEKVAGSEEKVAVANGWGLCSDCSACSDMTSSSASGTWKIKFNKKASARLEHAENIKEAYAFPSYVKEVMD